MYYEVYTESFLLVQFFMNLYLLEIVNHILFHTASLKRVVAGAALGAFCSILPFLLPVKLMYSMPGSFLLSFISMSLFTFRTYKWKQWLSVLEKMLLVTFLLGGFLMFLLKILPRGTISCLGIALVLALGAVCYIVIRRMMANKEDAEHICRVVLKNGNHSLTLDALVDTGNSLVEPISGKPVSVIEESAFRELIQNEAPERFRVIPYRSVGKANGIMKGYLLDSMIVELQGVRKECGDIYMAVSDELISEKSNYRMILNPGVLKERGVV